jgi:hypothetical protein
MEKPTQNSPRRRIHASKTTKVNRNLLLTGWEAKEAITLEAGWIETKASELSTQGAMRIENQTTRFQGIRFQETTLIIMIDKRDERSLSLGTQGFQIGSHVLQIGYFR